MSTILVVDDEASARNALARLLRKEGYDVETAGNGREALAALESPEHKPDLMLLDLMMPEIDGLELLEILQASPAWKALPVVVLTAISDTHTVHRAEQLGAREYLVKASFSLSDMLEHVKRYTGGPGHPPS
ncbi:MAG TPA: response regulator [Tepidisphaeraceae bacterium]|nr:response regulator [Tepidisphaeraceae bacterium]